MTHAVIGEPHSVQRYLAFGVIAGFLAGIVAAVFHLSLPVVATTGGVLAALGAGTRAGKVFPRP
jgi:hypothetical protein